MSPRGIVIGVVALLALVGCGPPIGEAEFIQRMTALDGVTGAYISEQQPLPFAYTYSARVQVTSSLTAPQLREMFDHLADMRDFDSYGISEDVEHPQGVRWDAGELPDRAELDFLAAVWPVAAALPEGTTVELGDSATSLTSVSASHTRESKPEPDALMAVDFIAFYAQTVPQAPLDFSFWPFTFDGIPGECPGLVGAVTAIVGSADVTSVRVVCNSSENLIAVSVLDDPAEVRTGVGQVVRGAGFDLTVTPDDYRIDPNLPSELIADVTAVADAARAVPGAPAASTTRTGIEFGIADEATVRAILEVLEPMPEFDRVTFQIGVGDDTHVVRVGKSAGTPVYLDQILAAANHPSVTRWSVGSGGYQRQELQYDIAMSAPTVEDAVAALRGAGLHEAVGTHLDIIVIHGDRIFASIVAVVEEDGTLTSPYELDPKRNKPLIDAWNAA